MTFKEAVGLPALLVGAVVALAVLFRWLGLDVSTAPAKLERHIVAESGYHARKDTAMKELDAHAEANEDLLEALIRGECLENPARNLARQGLIAKCNALGIRRRP